MPKDPYGGPWKRIRLEVLERDGWVCQVRGPKCRTVATEVDHIIETSKGGAWWDKSNLRASCKPCNLGRIDRRGAERWKQASTRIVLVVGPPGAAKAEHVAENRRPGDLVVDYDAMATALGSDGGFDHDDSLHGAVMAARNAVLRSLRRGETGAARAWIITSNPQAESVFPFHERVVIDPGQDAVRQTAISEHRPSSWLALVDEWYAKRSGTTASATAGTPSRNW